MFHLRLREPELRFFPHNWGSKLCNISVRKVLRKKWAAFIIGNDKTFIFKDSKILGISPGK